MLKGSIVALITPFKDDNLDENTYRSLIDYHLNNGTNGIVPGGTTGESPTLSHSEHKKIIEIAVKECKEIKKEIKEDVKTQVSSIFVYPRKKPITYKVSSKISSTAFLISGLVALVCTKKVYEFELAILSYDFSEIRGAISISSKYFIFAPKMYL